MDRRRATTLSIVLTGDEPPSEFRIFASGPNETTKGTFVFDEAAATSVLSEYQAHGIDLMLDYDHASLGTGIDPALSGKAAGWFNLEVRGGELWAVNVRWTPPAAEALRRKEWRFMSPAFSTDDAGHITSVLNVAITNLPATRRLQPLMAATRIALGETAMLDAESVKKAMAALVDGNADACMAILTDMIATAAAGGEAPAEPAEAAAETAPADPEKEKPEVVMAATAQLSRITNTKTIAAAVAEVEVWRQSHLKLETETQKLAQERKVLDDAERRRLCVSLVTEAGQAPARVWATSEQGAPPKKYLATMPLADLRDFVADAIKASVGKAKAPGAPVGGGTSTGGSDVVTTDGRTVTLSARELAMCAEMKIDPKDYAGRKPAKKD